MTFIIHGLSGHEAMPMSSLFKGRAVKKPGKLAGYRGIDPKQNVQAEEFTDPLHQHAGIASKAYIKNAADTGEQPELLAEHVMTSPVVVLSSEVSIAEALQLFQEKKFRHVPVISSTKALVGMISDRDILRYMSGITGEFEYRQVKHKLNDKLEKLMIARVLSANSDTDVRYIARLFVEQRIGAMPIIKQGKLSGIITRSDILHTVMQHFSLELWA